MEATPNPLVNTLNDGFVICCYDRFVGRQEIDELAVKMSPSDCILQLIEVSVENP